MSDNIDMRYLRERVAHFTECQLAMLEDCKMRKSTSKSDLSRHDQIASSMVEFVKAIGITADVACLNPRLRQRLGVSATSSLEGK